MSLLIYMTGAGDTAINATVPHSRESRLMEEAANLRRDEKGSKRSSQNANRGKF